MLIYFIRHGDPTYSPDDLTPFGRKQAEAVAKRLSFCNIDEIYSSTSKRSVETAKPFAKTVNKEIKLLDWCNEYYTWQEFTIVDFDGQRKWLPECNKIKNSFVSEEIYKMGNDWVNHPDFSNTGCKTGLERINRETDLFLGEYGYIHDRTKHCYYAENANDKRIALFAHLGFSWAFLSSLLDIPYPQFAVHFSMNCSAISVVEFAGTGYIIPKIITYSNDSHLYKEDLPLRY